MQSIQLGLPYILQATSLIVIGLGLAGLAGVAAARRRPTVKLKARK